VFPPGSKLNVEQICRDLGVSRTPVWDTMRRLESEGLVNTVPRHGVFVLNYGADRIRDLFAVRGALEALAVRQAAQNADDAARAGLHASVQEMERAAGAGLMEQYSRAAIDFHDRVLVAAGNPVLNRLLENVYAQILVLRLRSLYLPERVESSVAEHRELFEAVRDRDAERGERLARAHAEHVLQDALEFTRRSEESR
jgi:DNA-binding GntR family transcriptional regulator